jgi:hypothetical protein
MNDDGIWVTGEYGEQLLGGKAQLLEGEDPLRVTSQELVSLLGAVLAQPGIAAVSTEYLLTALAKLSSRVPEQSDRIKVPSLPSSPHAKQCFGDSLDFAARRVCLAIWCCLEF